jgi:hypothetical protein
VELGRAQDPYWNRTPEHRPLVSDLRRIIASAELVASDDRHHYHPLHAGSLAGLVQVTRCNSEELHDPASRHINCISLFTDMTEQNKGM